MLLHQAELGWFLGSSLRIETIVLVQLGLSFSLGWIWLASFSSSLELLQFPDGVMRIFTFQQERLGSTHSHAVARAHRRTGDTGTQISRQFAPFSGATQWWFEPAMNIKERLAAGKWQGGGEGRRGAAEGNSGIAVLQ